MRTMRSYPRLVELQEAGADDLVQQAKSWGGEPDLTDWEYPDRWLPDAIDLPLETRTLRVIATPGHTRGHVVFHDVDSQVLFAGDHVLPHITPSIAVEPLRPLSPLRDYMASLRLVRELPDARLLPAHGPAATSVHLRIDELVRHHEERLALMAAAVEKGASSAYDVAVAIGWTRHHRRYDELDMGNQMMALQETIAHLRLLVEDGQLTETRVDGVIRYAP
jgi:glyoxylase-like metal-dependent hydrolase (beta-lactamase superfamily II)